MILWLILFIVLILIGVFYYLRIIRLNTLLPKYSDKYSIEHISGPSPLENSLMYWNDVKKSIFREGIYGFDADGVFVFYENGKPIYQPAGVPLAFLSFLNDYVQTKDETLVPKMKAQLQWMATNYTAIGDNRIVWYYLYEHEGHKGPWSSGIAQGFAISALVRAYLFFKDDTYLDLAIKAFNQMHTPLKEGGHTYCDNHYALWYEEASQPTHILNGHIYSLLGVLDLYHATKNEFYKSCFDKGIQSIIDNIDEFDLGFFTKYSAASPNTCNNSYHHIHLRQFETLYQITGISFFKERAARFKMQYTDKQAQWQHLVYLVKRILRSKF